MTASLTRSTPRVPPAGHVTGPDGVEMISISLATSRTFAKACVTEWARIDGRSRHHLLRTAKAVWVPVHVLQAAREQLRKAGVVSDEQ